MTDGELTAFLIDSSYNAYFVTRGNRSQAFSSLNPIDNLYDGLPTIGLYSNLDGTRVYGFTLATFQPVVMSETNTGYSEPALVDSSNTATHNEYYPVYSPNERIMYFTPDQRIIARATRSSANDSFGTLEELPNTASSEPGQPEWVSDDDCELYIARDDIFVARRPL
jgi:hypothetical protein